MNRVGEKKTLTFDEALIEMGATKSWNTLIEKGMDPALLSFWLRYVVDSPHSYGGANENKRKASQLAKGAKKLANEIERAVKSPPISFIGKATELSGMLELERHLPDNLRAYAGFYERLLSVRWPRRTITNPQTDRVAVLLDIVKECTESYHYSMVVDVLNAMDVGRRGVNGDTRWDVTSLKQKQYRARRRLKKIIGT